MEDLGRIWDGFWEDFEKIFGAFWKDLGGQTMIRATTGKSMDGWMDGWMDGEVLIIGKVVGWSGWVPKGLTCGGMPKVHGV